MRRLLFFKTFVDFQKMFFNPKSGLLLRKRFSMVKETPKVKNWDKKHAAILEVATKIFIHQGYSATSMELIAKEAGVSKITIYKHFKNKADLFSHIMENYC